MALVVRRDSSRVLKIIKIDMRDLLPNESTKRELACFVGKSERLLHLTDLISKLKKVHPR